MIPVVFVEIVLNAVFVWCIIGIIRTTLVAKYRLKVLNRMHDRYREEINAGNGFTKWRFDEWDKVSFNRMVILFWRPLPSFFEDTKLEPELYKD